MAPEDTIPEREALLLVLLLAVKDHSLAEAAEDTMSLLAVRVSNYHPRDNRLEAKEDNHLTTEVFNKKDTTLLSAWICLILTLLTEVAEEAVTTIPTEKNWWSTDLTVSMLFIILLVVEEVAWDLDPDLMMTLTFIMAVEEKENTPEKVVL